MSHFQRWTQIARSSLITLLGVVALIAATLIAALPSSAASGEPTTAGSPGSDTAYTFWSYWTGEAKGEWTFAQAGAQSTIPADATSQGWRFGIGQTPTLTEQPRAAVDFEATCSGTAPIDGKKRVAVIIDSGTTAEAPGGQVPPGLVSACASVPTNANGLQVLSAVSAVRQDSSGLVCGVGNYPTSGCGEQVSVANLTAQNSASPQPASSQTSGSTNWLPFALGAIIIVIVALAAVAVARRRRDRSA